MPGVQNRRKRTKSLFFEFIATGANCSQVYGQRDRQIKPLDPIQSSTLNTAETRPRLDLDSVGPGSHTEQLAGAVWPRVGTRRP